nr:hypothetical protein [Paracoccus saliphilus]
MLRRARCTVCGATRAPNLTFARATFLRRSQKESAREKRTR